MKKKIPRLALGTVQFGHKYGFKNTVINKQKEINKILNLLNKKKIKMIDTASDYSKSEKRIGKYSKKNSFKIISKIPKIKSKIITNKDILILEKKFQISLKNLNRKKIYGLLVHSFEDILKQGSEYLIDFLRNLKKKGYVKKIGISVYNPNEFYKAIKIFDLDIVQFPLNILDQRFLRIKLSSYKKIEFFARSIFLQGLLLQNYNNINSFFNLIKKKLIKFKKYLEKKKISQLEACITFALEQKNIGYLVFGVDSYDEFKEIIKIKKSKEKIQFSKFAMNKSQYIDPRNWKINNA